MKKNHNKELVLPNGCSAISEEEMMDVNGGASLFSVVYWTGKIIGKKIEYTGMNYYYNNFYTGINGEKVLITS